MPSSSSHSVREAASQLRVLHVVESWLPRSAGYTTRGWEIVRAQSDEARLAPRVLVTSRQHVYGTRQAAAPPGLEGRVRLVEPSAREQWIRRARAFYVDRRHLAEAVQRAGRSWNVDLIHGHWSSTIGQAAAEAAGTLGVPFVAEVRFDLAGAVMTETVRFSLPLLERLLRRWFERHLARADAVVAASYSLADLLRREFPHASERLGVVPNGIDRTGFAPGPGDAALHRKLGLGEAVVVGSTTNMLRYEGIDLLLDALPAVLARGTRVQVLLVGSGTQHEALKRRAEREKLPVTFTGRVPKAEVPRYLRLMDLFAVPRRDASVTRYASPIKVVEAMACGVPVVGSRVGDLPDLLAEGRGRLVEPGSVPALTNALRELSADAERRAAMSRRAQDWAASYLTWTDTADLYRSIYQQAQRRFQTAQQLPRTPLR